VLRTLGRHIFDNVELYLMGLSVAIAVALPLAIEIGTNDQELAVTALLACVFQGLVLWSMRRRYRRIRREMIAELRGMLKDRINNYLAIVLMSVTHRRDQASASEREFLEAAIAATTAVSQVLEELSMETLRAWKAKYRLESLPLSLLAGGARAEAIPRARAAAGSRTRQ
jgi:isocitrate dehydrogenase kinase/phosphatase